MDKRLLFLAVLVLASGLVYSFSSERISPSDHITQDHIRVYDDKIVIDVSNAHWATFTDTNSMDPVFDIESNTIEIKPKEVSQVNIGDIVSYHSTIYPGIVIHRVIDIGYDSDGWYAILKGDNNLFRDNERVRFSQVNGIVIAVLY